MTQRFLLALPLTLAVAGLSACPDDGGSITGLDESKEVSTLSDDEYCDAQTSSINWFADQMESLSRSDFCVIFAQQATAEELFEDADTDYEASCEAFVDLCESAAFDGEWDDIQDDLAGDVEDLREEAEDCEGAPSDLEDCEDTTIGDLEACLEFQWTGQFGGAIEAACTEPGDDAEEIENPCDDICDEIELFD